MNMINNETVQVNVNQDFELSQVIQKLTQELVMMYDRPTFKRIEFLESGVSENRYKMVYKLDDTFITLVYDLKKHVIAMLSKKIRKNIDKEAISA
ncbi:hypothetical protein ACU3L3_14295 [Priestia endophytica]